MPDVRAAGHPDLAGRVRAGAEVLDERCSRRAPRAARRSCPRGCRRCRPCRARRPPRRPCRAWRRCRAGSSRRRRCGCTASCPATTGNRPGAGVCPSRDGSATVAGELHAVVHRDQHLVRDALEGRARAASARGRPGPTGRPPRSRRTRAPLRLKPSTRSNTTPHHRDLMRQLACGACSAPSPRRTAAAPGRRSCCLHGFTDTWRTWELVLPRSSATTTCSRRRWPGTRAGRRSRARSPTPCSPTRSSARWTRRASRPRTSPATRSAATSRCSSPRAAARSRSSRSRRPAAGRRATSPSGTCSARSRRCAELVEAAAPHADGDRRHAGGPAPRHRSFIAENFEHIPAELLAHQMRGAARCDAALGR